MPTVFLWLFGLRYGNNKVCVFFEGNGAPRLTDFLHTADMLSVRTRTSQELSNSLFRDNIAYHFQIP